MAQQGIRFTRFYSGAPVCSPTRGSCMTGRHPYRFGVFHANEGHITSEERTLAELLRESGYATGHFGKWHLGTLTTKVKDSNRGRPGNLEDYSPPWENGFDVCFSTEAKVPTWNPMLVPAEGCGANSGANGKAPGADYETRYWLGPDQAAEDNLEGDDSRIIMDRAIPFIRRSAAEKRPFFAVIWFHAPHLPAVAGEPYLQMYAGEDKDHQHYYGCITAMDEQIGRLRSELGVLGIDNNTMLWFCSDNGPEGDDNAPGRTKGLRGRKRSLYEGGVRVPGLLVWPEKIEHGRVTDLPCTTSDYLPTILDILGYQSGSGSERPIDGISLYPLINGQMIQRNSPIAFESRDQWSLIGDRFKLYSPDKGKSFELYDITTDPDESDNLAGRFPEQVNSMKAILEDWRESCQKSLKDETM
jgi:arylsulfatase A-like enzyme